VLGIRDGDLNLHVSDIQPPVAFGDAQLFTVRVASRIQPGLVVKTRGLDNQSVSFPVAD